MIHLAPADRAIAITATLAELDLRSDDHVLIMLADGVGFVEAFVGVTRWGAVPLSVNPRLAAADVAAIAAQTGARLVLASTKRLPHLAELDAEPPVLVDGLRGLWAIPLHPRCTGDGDPPGRGRRVPITPFGGTVTPSAKTGRSARPAGQRPAGPARGGR